MSQVIFADRIYIPITDINVRQAKKEFTKVFFGDDGVCRKCENFDERPTTTSKGCEVCQVCDNFGGSFKLFKEVELEGEDYIGLPTGAKKKIIKLWPELRELGKDEQRPTPKLSKALRDDWEFVWEPFDYQVEAVDAMIAAGFGVLEAPPRSGKTVMGILMLMKMGLKAIILASQSDWLEQFMETFYEATNLEDIEKAQGKRYVGIAKKDEDYKNLDIVLATYQSFLSDGKGKERFRMIQASRGVLMIDEVHKSAADEFAKVVNAISVKHRIGLTGTPDRKDGKYELVNNILGPVQYVVEVESLVPTIRFQETAFTKTYKTWTPYIKALAEDKKRNMLIVDMVEHYLDKGHCIVIPVYHVAHVDTLVKMINARIGRKIAVPFTGKLHKLVRRQTILDARKGKKVRVVVGIRSIVQTGINVPKWSCMIEVMPISNPPQHQQEVSRVLTKLPDKPDPIIHYLVDRTGIGIGCLKNCVSNTHQRLKHTISEKSWEKLRGWFAGHGGRKVVDEDEKPQKSGHGSRPVKKTAPREDSAAQSKFTNMFKSKRRGM